MEISSLMGLVNTALFVNFAFGIWLIMAGVKCRRNWCKGYGYLIIVIVRVQNGYNCSRVWV